MNAAAARAEAATMLPSVKKEEEGEEVIVGVGVERLGLVE